LHHRTIVAADDEYPGPAFLRREKTQHLDPVGSRHRQVEANHARRDGVELVLEQLGIGCSGDRVAASLADALDQGTDRWLIIDDEQ